MSEKASNETETPAPIQSELFPNEGFVARPTASISLPNLAPTGPKEARNPISELQDVAQRIGQIQPPPPRPRAIRVHQRFSKAFD